MYIYAFYSITQVHVGKVHVGLDIYIVRVKCIKDVGSKWSEIGQTFGTLKI